MQQRNNVPFLFSGLLNALSRDDINKEGLQPIESNALRSLAKSKIKLCTDLLLSAQRR
jgi:hypothetical protein